MILVFIDPITDFHPIWPMMLIIKNIHAFSTTGHIKRDSGSQTRGAGSEIRWDPPNLTPGRFQGGSGGRPTESSTCPDVPECCLVDSPRDQYDISTHRDPV